MNNPRIYKSTNESDNAFLVSLPEDLPPASYSAEDTITMLKEASRSIKAIGLHARQIGINRNIFILIDDDVIVHYSNPRNVRLSGEKVYGIEKCYSEVDINDRMIPYNVRRYDKIEFDSDEKKDVVFTGWIARVCQHEIGHGKGQLLSDHPDATFAGTVIGVQKIGRNDPCKCGSQKKFKRCCGG